MFNFYGFTEQLPQTTFIINTSLSSTKIINNLTYKFIKVKEKFMYGIIEKQMSGGIINISDKERTMMDMIFQCNFVGGLSVAMEKVKTIIKDNDCDIKKLVDYAIKFPVLKVRKTIGIILDEAEIAEEISNPLYESIQNTSLISLNWNLQRTGTVNKKWRAIQNDTSKD
jgi:predicted transcriptional regulator of viral defense system